MLLCQHFQSSGASLTVNLTSTAPHPSRKLTGKTYSAFLCGPERGLFPSTESQEAGAKAGQEARVHPWKETEHTQGLRWRGAKGGVPGREGSQDLLALDLLAGGRDLAEAQAGRPNLLPAIVFGAGKQRRLSPRPSSASSSPEHGSTCSPFAHQSMTLNLM